MTSLAMDMCENVPYVASLRESTAVYKAAPYKAKPPVVSPVEALRVDRDRRMLELLAGAVMEADSEGHEVKISALENVEAFLRLLPSDFPATDPYVSDVGSVCFDWDFDSRNQFSVLLKDKNQIAFAAYFSGEKVHGSTRFSSHELPESLAATAHRWLRAGERQAHSG